MSTNLGTAAKQIAPNGKIDTGIGAQTGEARSLPAVTTAPGRSPAALWPRVTSNGRIAALLSLAAFVLYWSTLAPGVVGHDGGEFQFVPYVLGLPHPTGYPLYTLFGKLWTILVPFGSIAYRMNLLSAVAASMAVGICFLIVVDLTGRTAAGLAAALALAANAWFWGLALAAGVRPLHSLLILSIVLVALAWRRRVLGGRDASRALSGLALLVGLSLAHHRTTLFVLPGLALFVVWTQRGLLRAPRRLAGLALLAALPCLSYLYLLIRGVFGDPFAQLPVYDLSSWLTLITGSGQTGTRLILEPGPMWQRALGAVAELSRNYSAAGLLVALAGVLWLARHERAALILWGSAFALTALMLSGLAVGNGLEDGFYMNLFLLVPLFLGAGVALLLGLLESLAPRPLRPSVQWLAGLAAIAAVLLLVAFPGAQSIQATNSAPLPPSRLTLAGVQAIRLVEDSLPRLAPNAMVLGDWTQITPFWYYQQALGVRPDVRLYYSVNEWRAIGLEEQRFGRPLYLARKVPEMQGLSHLGMTGPLIHWAAQAQRDTPPQMQPLRASFDEDFLLLGYQQRLVASNGRFTSRPYIVQLSLWWQAKRPLAKDYAISLRMLNSENAQVAQVDSLHPVLGLSPTNSWDAGEVVEDYYELRADPGDRSPEYQVELLVYSKDSAGKLTNARLADGQTERLALPELPVEPKD